MDQDTPGVTPADSPAAEPEIQGQLPPDRPPQNVVAEFNRKFGSLSQKLDTVMAWIAAQGQAQPPPPTPGGQSYEDELYTRATNGDRAAFEEYMARQTDRRVQVHQQAQQHEGMIQAQINAIAAKYPVIADPGHPLRQHADLAYNLLVQRGYPQSKATVLEAMKTAITDRPDLVADLHTQGAQAREHARRSAASTAQSGQTRVTHQQSASPSTAKIRVTPEEAALAQRMNIKDPAGAKARFLERMEQGRSALGAVSSAVRQEDF